ncbi:hypothetical protein E3N88_09419 [Mikania micrantha]|uniref:Uncharacterized protein n=1 Tax=Mikania micrantha TaxID=192012 RepID=A0A5N6PLA2_9ASTR|nr:hypothetical protein E3N88_09419 [Mikania micrantha]
MALEDASFHLHASQIQSREPRFGMLEEIYRKLAQFPIPPPIELGDLPGSVLLSSGFGSNDSAPLLPRFTGLNPDRFPYVSDCFCDEAADWFSYFQSTEWFEFLASLVYRFGYSQHNQIAYALQSTSTEYALKVFDEMPNNTENAMVKEILKTTDDEILGIHTESTVDVNESPRAPTAPMDIFNYIFVHETVAPSIIILWVDDLKEHDMVAIKDYIAYFFHTKHFNAQHLKFTAAHQLFYSKWQALDLAFGNNGNSHMIEHEILTGGVHLWHKWKSKFWKSRSSKQRVLTNHHVLLLGPEPFSFNKNLPKDDSDIAPQKVNLETKKARISSSRDLWMMFCNASAEVVIVVGGHHEITILTGTLFGPFAGHKFHNEVKNPTLQFVDFSNIDTTNFESLSRGWVAWSVMPSVRTLAHVATLSILTYVIISLMTHRFCVHTILSKLNFSWLHWPQASPPLFGKQAAYISCLDPFKGAQLPRVFVGDKENLNLLVTGGVNAEANLNMALTICLGDAKLFNKIFALAEVF